MPSFSDSNAAPAKLHFMIRGKTGSSTGLPTPPKPLDRQVSPITFPLQSRSDPGGVGRPAHSAEIFHES